MFMPHILVKWLEISAEPKAHQKAYAGSWSLNCLALPINASFSSYIYITIHYILYPSAHPSTSYPPTYPSIHPFIHRFTFSVNLSGKVLSSAFSASRRRFSRATEAEDPAVWSRRMLGLALEAALDSMLYEQISKKHIYSTSIDICEDGLDLNVRLD